MAKRFKLKLTIPSFQLCRSKKLSTFPGNPVPAIYRLSPVNPKALDVVYPNLPAPPPSTPEDCYCVHCNMSSKIMSLAKYGCRPRPCKHHLPFNYTTNSPDSVYCKTGAAKGKKLKGGGRRGTTSVSSRRSNFVIDNQEESESLISCLTSFSDEFCRENIVLSQETVSYKIDKEISRKKVQRLRFQGSHDGVGSETGGRKKTATSRGSDEGKVKESFAVVKRSKDPYKDFKKSMLEMIMEMEMFEAKELEQLLQCFLTLNSQHYHGVIARAFIEIWQELFCEPCIDHKKSPNDTLRTLTR